MLGKDSHRRATSGLCVGRLSIQAIAQVLYRRSLIWPNSSPAVSGLRSRIGVIQSVPATNLATGSRKGRGADWHTPSLDSSPFVWVGYDISGDPDCPGRAAESSDVTVPATSAVRAPETAAKLPRLALPLNPSSA